MVLKWRRRMKKGLRIVKKAKDKYFDIPIKNQDINASLAWVLTWVPR